MIIRALILSVLWIIICSQKCLAEYEIKGKVNISEGWQHQIFLSNVNKLDEYYSVNPEDIIQVGSIESDGTFTLKGDNLPVETRFYRLYLIKEENSAFDACMYFEEEDHNFIHIILDNNTKIDIQSDQKHRAPFSNYTLSGDEANIELRKLSKLIFPSFYFYQIQFPSERQFSQQKLNRDLFSFADSSKHILVSLAAVINTEMDKNFEVESQYYLDFGDRLSKELNNHNYTEDYFRKINYNLGEYDTSKGTEWLFITIGVLSLALLFALLKIYKLTARLNALIESKSVASENMGLALTNQEEKILSLILAEKSNKEIASELFIELSTVKTHINKLYSKLGAKNRKEAKSLARLRDKLEV